MLIGIVLFKKCNAIFMCALQSSQVVFAKRRAGAAGPRMTEQPFIAEISLHGQIGAIDGSR